MLQSTYLCCKLADGSVGVLIPVGRAFDPEKDGLAAFQEGGIFSVNIVPPGIQLLNDSMSEVTAVQTK